MRAFGLLILLLCSLTACGPRGAFATSFPVNRSDALADVLARARAKPRAPQQSVVVGVGQSPRGAFAYDIAAGRLLWKQTEVATGVPIAAGPFVMVPEGGQLKVRALASGNVVHAFSSGGMNLIGADSDGTVTAIVLSTGGSMGARSRLILLDGERIAFETTVSQPLGGPAVLGGLVFVPHNRVHLSVLDVGGNELARVGVRDDVASQAIARDGELYFGLLGMYRLDEKTPQGLAAGAAYYRPQRTEPLPGQPHFLPDTTQPPPPPDSATHRVALRFTPSDQGKARVGLADDTLYLLFYRELFALDPMAEKAHWVYQSDYDVVGVQGVPGGVLLVDEQGTLTTLDAQGRPLGTRDLGLKPLVAKIRADRLEGHARSEAEPQPLALSLYEAAANPDNRLVPARVMAVGLLADLEDGDATQGLINLCEDRASPERVRRGACVALSRRAVGSGAILEALDRHADYLTDTRPPPVGPLADAALKTADARAVRPLLAHLQDPATSADDLSPLMQALKGLAEPSSAEPIADFLRMYHADAEEPRMADALVIAVEALAKIQGAGAVSVLDPIANDALTTPPVRSAAARVLASLEQKGDAAVTDAPKPAAEPEVEPEPVPEGPPARLTTAHIDRALAPVREKLTQCVRADPKRPMSARLTLVIEGDGRLTLVQTLPESLRSCVEPLVRGVTFPATTWGKRDTLSTTITR